MATDYYRLRVQGLHQTEYNECVMFFRGQNLDAAEYLVNARDLVLAWTGTILPLWLDLFPTSYQVLRLSGAKASPGGSGEVSQQFPINSQIGTQTGGAASQQLCPVIRLIPPMGVKTAGKMFLPCIAEGDVSANIVSAGWLGRVSDMMAEVLSGFNDTSITWDQVIYSRKLVTFSEALSYDTSPIIGFQRRRQRSPL